MPERLDAGLPHQILAKDDDVMLLLGVCLLFSFAA